MRLAERADPPGAGPTAGGAPQRRGRPGSPATARPPTSAVTGSTLARAYRTTPIAETRRAEQQARRDVDDPDLEQDAHRERGDDAARPGDRVPAGHRRRPRRERGVVADDRRRSRRRSRRCRPRRRSPRPTGRRRRARARRRPAPRARARSRGASRSIGPNRSDTAPQSRNEKVVAAAVRIPMMPTSREAEVQPVDVDDRVERCRGDQPAAVEALGEGDPTRGSGSSAGPGTSRAARSDGGRSVSRRAEAHVRDRADEPDQARQGDRSLAAEPVGEQPADQAPRWPPRRPDPSPRNPTTRPRMRGGYIVPHRRR